MWGRQNATTKRDTQTHTPNQTPREGTTQGSTETLRRPHEPAKVNSTIQASCWLELLSPFILAFERLLIRLTTVHSSLVAHRNILRLNSDPRPEAPLT